MKIRSSAKSFLTLESVAMTDIVMNLFIFFFISFSLLYTFNPNKESKIEVKLPDAKIQQKIDQSDSTLVVTVTSGNEIFVAGKRVRPQDLKTEISARKQSAQNGVLVRADKAASVDFLVQVLAAAKQSDIHKLGVAIDEK